MKLVRGSLTALGNNTLGLWANEDGYANISHTMSNGGTENNSIDISTVIGLPLGRMHVNVAQLYFADYLIEVEKRKTELNCELFEQGYGKDTEGQKRIHLDSRMLGADVHGDTWSTSANLECGGVRILLEYTAKGSSKPFEKFDLGVHPQDDGLLSWWDGVITDWFKDNFLNLWGSAERAAAITKMMPSKM